MSKGIISSFLAKFNLYKANINRLELNQYLNLKACSDANGLIPAYKIQIFTGRISQIKKDMKSRFQYLLEL